MSVPACRGPHVIPRCPLHYLVQHSTYTQAQLARLTSAARNKQVQHFPEYAIFRVHGSQDVLFSPQGRYLVCGRCSIPGRQYRTHSCATVEPSIPPFLFQSLYLLYSQPYLLSNVFRKHIVRGDFMPDNASNIQYTAENKQKQCTAATPPHPPLPGLQTLLTRKLKHAHPPHPPTHTPPRSWCRPTHAARTGRGTSPTPPKPRPPPWRTRPARLRTDPPRHRAPQSRL